MLLPWPARRQRQEAISDARREKERSQSSARHAATIEQDIARMAERNHFASSIAEQIMQQHRGAG
jgi:hypothetical protein